MALIDTNDAFAIDALVALPQHGYIGASGDSKLRQNSSATATDATFFANGQMVWAAILSDQRLRFIPELNYGVNGQTLAEINARLDANIADAKARGAIALALNGGTNNLPAQTALADMQSLALTAIGKVIGAGLVCYYVALTPRGVWDSLTAPQIVVARQRRNAFNRWLKRLTIPGLIVVDANPYLTDPASNDDPIGGISGAQTAQTIDGLHEGVGAAFWEGMAIAQAIKRSMPQDPVREVGNLNLQSADNPFGNIFPNPHFLGTDGTLVNVGGVAPTGWTVERVQGNGSCTAGIVTRQVGPTTLNMLQLVIAAGTQATECYLRPTSLIAKSGRWDTGDRLVTDWPVELDTSSQALLYLTPRLVERNSAAATVQSRNGLINPLINGAQQFLPDQAWSGVITTPPLASDGTAVDASAPRMQMLVSANKTVTARFWLPSFRKLTAA